MILPTINYLADPAFNGLDFVPAKPAGSTMKSLYRTPSASAEPTAASFSGGANETETVQTSAAARPSRYVREPETGLVWHRCFQRTLYATRTARRGLPRQLPALLSSAGPLMRDASHPTGKSKRAAMLSHYRTGNHFQQTLRYDDPMSSHPPGGNRTGETAIRLTITHAESGAIICRGFTRHCALNARRRPVAIDPKTVHLWKTFPE